MIENNFEYNLSRVILELLYRRKLISLTEKAEIDKLNQLTFKS